MHTRIELDMYRKVGNTFFLCCFNQFIQQMETIDFRFQLILEHGLESCEFRIHDDDGTGDTRFSQVGTFVRYRHRQVIHPMVLQGLRHFIRTCAIGRCLHHANHLRFRLQLAPIIIQVVHQRIQIDFQDGFMYFQLHAVGDVIEMKTTGTLNQDNFIPKSRQQIG